MRPLGYPLLMPTHRREVRRTSRSRRRWPTVLGFLALLAAAGLLTVYALSQSAEANGSQRPTDTNSTGATLTAKVPQIDIVGDSYVAGSAQGGKGATNWTKLIGSRFNARGQQVDMNVMALPGSGYLARGSTDLVFRETATLRLRPTADVVVVFGSRNDGRQTEAAMYQAAKSLYSDIHNIAPQAQVVVIGPVWVDADVPDFIAANNVIMARAAEEENVQYIDALEEGWFAGPEEGLIGADGIHPTDAGHAYLAAKLLPMLDEKIKGLTPAG